MGLTFIAIVLLVAAWAALLLPDLWRRGGVPRRSNSIASFNRQLSTLERARPFQRPGGRVVAFPHRPGIVPVRRVRVAPRSAGGFVPRNRFHARQRRQQVLFALAGLAFITLIAGVVVTPFLLVFHVLVDLALGGYLWLLVDHRNRSYERQTRLNLLGMAESSPRPLRRTASGS